MSTTTRSIGTARDHASITLWEQATDNELVDEQVIERGEAHDDFDHAGAVVMAGATTSALYYRHLIAAPGDEIDIITDTGTVWAATSSVLVINEDYFRFGYMRVGSNSGPAITIDVKTGIQILAAYITINTLNTNGTGIQHNGIDTVVANTVFAAPSGNAGSYGIVTLGGGGGTNLTIQNCVIFNFKSAGEGHGINMDAGRTVNIHNTIIMDCTDNWGQLAASAATSSNNMSSSAASFGSSPAINAVLADVFVNVLAANFAADYNLKLASAAIGAGVDRSVSGIITDFIGAPWGSTWDMGIFKFPEVPGGNIIANYFYYLYRR